MSKAAFRVILADGTETVPGNPLRLLGERALLFVILVLPKHLKRVAPVIARRLARVACVSSLARSWIHTLIARLHRYLVAAVLVFAGLRLVATALAVEDFGAIDLSAAA